MTRTLELSAQWALWSKEPDRPGDYRILRCSDGSLTPVDFAGLISAYRPAAPPAERREGPGAPPWVTFSPGEVRGEPALGVAVFELTADTDHGFRRIAPTKYFCLPFEQLRSGPVGYAALAAAALDSPLPDASRDPVRLSVPAMDSEAIARSIEGLGVEWTATVASLVLAGRVALVTLGDAVVASRVAALDAVAALLPYAVRVQLAVSTWADVQGDRIRLAFCDRQWQGQYGVGWDHRPPGVPVGGPPGEYRGLLVRMCTERGVQEVVTHLAAQSEPCVLEPRAVIDRLSQLNRPQRVAQLADQDAADPAEVRAILDRPPELVAPEVCLSLARFLLRTEQRSEDITRLGAHWNPALEPELTAAAATALLGRDPAGTLEGYVGIAERHGFLDPLLAEMVRRTASIYDRDAPAVHLVWSRLRDLGPGAWPELRRSLAANRWATSRLLALEAGRGADARLQGVAEWLAGGGTDAAWVRRVYEFVFADPSGEALSDDALQEVAYLGHQHVRLLLEVAQTCGRLAAVLPAAGRWLAFWWVGGDVVSEQDWASTLQRLEAGERTPADVTVQLDLLAMMTQRSWRLPLERRLGGDDEAASAYLGALRARYAAPPLGGIFPLVNRRLIESVPPPAWANSPTLAGRVLDLLDIVQWRAEGSEVVAVVVRAVEANRELVSLPQYRRGWAALVDRTPEGAMLALRLELGMDTPPHRLAELAVPVLRSHDWDVEPLLHLLAEHANRWTAPRIEGFLSAVRSEMWHQRWSQRDVRLVDTRFVHAILASRLGDPLAADYRRLLAAAVRYEIERGEWMLPYVTDELDPGARLAVHDAGRRITDATRPQRSRSSGLLSRWTRGGGKGTDDGAGGRSGGAGWQQ